MKKEHEKKEKKEKIIKKPKKKESAAAVLQKQTGKWKAPVMTYIIVMVCCLYMGLLIGCNYQHGDLITDIFRKIGNVFSDNPLKIGIKNGLSQPKTLAASVFIFLTGGALYVLMDLSKNHNYMRGKEFGTADWASADVINRKFQNFENPSWNRVYSNTLRISMKNPINNNVLAIGGSGVGKSFFFLTPNIYQADASAKYPGSYVFTDPKGELLLKNGKYLKDKGYRIKVINLVPGQLNASDGFNPFEYIRSETDIITLIQNLFANTTPKGASAGDPFWEKAELMFLQSLFLLVWMEPEWLSSKYPDMEMNFNAVLDLLSMAQIGDKPEDKSPLDILFDELVADTFGQKGKGENHPAWLAYHKTMVGAADTKRSIVISANARLAIFENEEVRRLLRKDELDLASIGTGIADGKKNVKTALFCVIPDSKSTYNAIAGMLYTLLFQELFYQADFVYGGELPVPVTFWLDEFANIKLPDDFVKWTTTMRSRQVSCVIIIQNLAQLKGMYEKEYGTVVGNCDVCVYLGGNEQETFEYISKNLGKKTIYKQSTGETKGRNGSSSKNEDALGRELMLPEEVRELDNDYCIVFVRGKKPVMDYKFRTLESPEFQKSVALGSYLHEQEKQLDKNELHLVLASQKELSEAYKTGNVIEINLDEHLLSSPEYIELSQIVVQNMEEAEEERKKEKLIDISQIPMNELLVMDELALTDDEIIEITDGLKHGLTDEEVKSYILYGDAKRMRSKRLLLEALKARKEAGV